MRSIDATSQYISPKDLDQIITVKVTVGDRSVTQQISKEVYDMTKQLNNYDLILETVSKLLTKLIEAE
jgi:hypothetical protein